MYASFFRSSALSASATLVLTLLSTPDRAHAQGGAQSPPAGVDAAAAPSTGSFAEASSDPALRVFPSDRASKDERLHRPARTADTRVEWRPDSDPVRRNERVEALKARMRVALGLWPHPSAGLEQLVTGVIDQGDYVIEKRSMMSHWYYFLASNIYIPKHVYTGSAPGLAPVVIVPCGSWDGGRLRLRSEEEARAAVASGEERELENARRPYHALATQLTRMGCVVILFDVTGSGESDELKASDFTSLERVARCQNLLGWHVWDAFNVLNHGWNMPRADQSRVAMLGNGPGAQIALMLALQEPRVKRVLALECLSAADQGETLAETAAHLRVGTSLVEYAAALAPRGLYVAGVGEDSCAAQARFAPSLEEQWELLASPAELEIACWPEGRTSLDVHMREGVYEHLNRVFGLGFDAPIVERPIPFISTRDLAVHGLGDRHRHPSEQPASAAIPLFTQLTDGSLNLLIHEETPYRVQIFKTWIGAALRILLDTGLPADGEVTSRVIGYERRADRAVLRLALGRVGSGEEVPAILVMPDVWNASVVVGVSGGGKDDFFGAPSNSSLFDAARVVDRGAAFLAIDALLTGESLNVASASDPLPTLPIDRKRHAQSVTFTSAYNRTLIGERVHDILTAIGFARAIDGVERVQLVGNGEAGTWALLARALAGEDVVERTAAQWSFTFAGIQSVDDPNFLPGGVRYGDMAYFTSLIAPGELCIVSPPGQGAVGIPEHVERTYNSLGMIQLVRTTASSDAPAVIDWLAGLAQ